MKYLDLSPLAITRLARTLHGIRHSNRTQASEIIGSLGGGALASQSAAILVALLQKQGQALNLDNLQRCLLLDSAVRQVLALKASSDGTAMLQAKLGQLRGTAKSYATALNNRLPTDPMPQGVSHLPPPRPANYDFGQLPLATVLRAADEFETNSHPVSNPTYEAPADPLFATWFRGLDQLGSRSLKMSEVAALVNTSTAPFAQRKALLFDPNKGVVPHEFHKMLGGFRSEPGSLMWTPGMGGEYGIIARITDEYEQDIPDDFGDMREVLPFLQKSERTFQSNAQKIDPNHWPNIFDQLSTGDQAAVKETVSALRQAGYVAEPQLKQLLEPLFKTLRTTVPGSPQRLAAAKAVVENMQQREKSLQTLSVSGITAELQMAQTFARYLKINRLDTSNPNDQVDAVAVYRLYRDMLSKGELISRDRVEEMLKIWGRPYVR
jgi:hypothetical protein